jgi:Tfp pilus assembly protein PilP
MLQKAKLGMVGLALLSSVACDRASEQQKKADEAQREASQEMNEVRAEASQEMNKLQAEANREVAEAQAKFSKIREEYRHEVEKNLINLDEEIAKLSTRIEVKKDGVKAGTRERLEMIREKRTEFQKDLASLETASARDWDSAKNALDKEWENLKALVNKET